MAPTEPLLLRVRDRIVTVLKTIVAGDAYNRTPYDVTKRFVHFREARGYPLFMVYIESAESPEFAGANHYEQNVVYTVKVFVKNKADTGKELLLSLTDIRKAINLDSKSGAAGTLGLLTTQARIADFWTDNGYLALEGFGWGEQRIAVEVTGDEGEL